MRPALRIGLFHFMFYVKGIQLWSCLDAQLLHHTFLGQASPGGTLPVSFHEIMCLAQGPIVELLHDSINTFIPLFPLYSRKQHKMRKFCDMSFS